MLPKTRCFQNICLINLRHCLTMAEQLIRLMVYSRWLLRPPRSSTFLDRSLSPAIRPQSWCSTKILVSSNHVKFHVIKSQHSSKYVDSQKLGSGFLLLLSRPFYLEGRGITFPPPSPLNRIHPRILSCAIAHLHDILHSSPHTFTLSTTVPRVSSSGSQQSSSYLFDKLWIWPIFIHSL